MDLFTSFESFMLGTSEEQAALALTSFGIESSVTSASPPSQGDVPVDADQPVGYYMGACVIA